MDLSLLYLIAFVSAVVVFVATPVVVRFSLSKRYTNNSYGHDIVNQRKVVRIGGVSLFVGLCGALISGYLLGNVCCYDDDYDALPSLFEFVALLVVFTLGVYDDIKGLEYRKKFVYQAIAAVLVICSGVSIDNLNGLFGIYEIPKWIGFVLSFVGIIFITNAMNFIDGIDGLLASIGISAFSIYALLFYMRGDLLYLSISVALVGGLLSFLYFNLFGMKRYVATKIMMGDSGSLTLGFILGVMVIKLWGVTSSSGDCPFVDYSHIIAITMVFIPSVDALYVILCRLKSRKSIFCPDMNHLHHRLLATGMSGHKVLLTIVAMNSTYLVLNILLALNIGLELIVTVDVIVWILFNYSICKREPSSSSSKLQSPINDL